MCHNVSHCVPRGMWAYHWDPGLGPFSGVSHTGVCVFVLHQSRHGVKPATPSLNYCKSNATVIWQEDEDFFITVIMVMMMTTIYSAQMMKTLGPTGVDFIQYRTW